MKLNLREPLALFSLVLMFTFTFPACTGNDSSSSDSKSVSSSDCTAFTSSLSGKEPHSVACLGSVKVEAGVTEWIKITGASLEKESTALNNGGGVINEVVFDSSGKITIDGLKHGDTVYFEVEHETNSVTWSEGLPFDFWAYYVGAFSLPDYTLATMIPMLHNVEGSFPSGDYFMKIRNTTGEPVDLNIYHVQKSDSDFTSGTLDINLIVYKAGEDNPVVPNLAEAEKIKQYLNETFAPAGITIGNMTVTFLDDPSALSINSEREMIDFLRSASRGTAGRDDVGINCFLLPGLPSNILGLDGAIPGPGFLHGTNASGIIAQASAYGFQVGDMSAHESDQRFLAKILAHEIGHYLSLFHTSERTGAWHDPLGDTPECDESADVNGDGLVTGPECRGKGASNLMFWTTDPSSIGEGDFQLGLTHDQGDLLNTHPSVL